MLVSSRATQQKLSKSSEGQGLRTDPATEMTGRTGMAEQKTPCILQLYESRVRGMVGAPGLAAAGRCESAALG